MTLFGASLLMFVAAQAAQSEAPPSPSPPSVDLAIRGKPLGNPGMWATNADYPASAMRERREGTTGFRLTYDVNGQPQKCDIISSSGHADLDTVTCDLVMSRARFQPGTNSAGEAVGGTYSNRIRWSLPERTAEPFPFSEPGSMTLNYMVDASGAVADCKVEMKGLRRAEIGDPCMEIRKVAPYPPPRDAEGKPVARRYRMKMDVTIEDVAASGGPSK